MKERAVTMTSWRQNWRGTRIFASLLAIAVVSGCGTTATSSGTAADASCAKRITLNHRQIPTCGPLRLAVFLPGTNNADLQGRIQYLEKTIPTIPGAKMTIFDGQFDATTQLNQIQDALQSHQYNAAIAAPVDGVLTCKALSQEAPADGVLVAVANLALCGRGGDEGSALRAPGTLTFVGGTQTPDYWRDYLTWIARQNPGPQQILALTDPPAPFPLTENFASAAAAVRKAYPDFKIAAEDATDLTVAGSFQKMSALIQAHPSATILVTMFSTETQGAVEALKAAGKLGSLKIYDKGTTPWAVAALKSGEITASSPERAVTSTATLLNAILDARAGKQVPAFIGNDGAATPPEAPASGFTAFTRQTIGSYAGQN
jgi:ABC-type sugar transport system substrate-binding protein